MWETYQRLLSLSTVLRTYINNSTETESQEPPIDPPSSPHMINISGAVTDLSSLVHEAFHAKVLLGFVERRCTVPIADHWFNWTQLVYTGKCFLTG